MRILVINPNSTEAVTRGIYEAVEPLRDIFVQLRWRFGKNGENTDVELRRRMRDVEDHYTRVLERVENYRALLTNLVNVQATLVAQRQNDEMARMTEAGYEQNEQVKRISSWAAIATSSSKSRP